MRTWTQYLVLISVAGLLHFVWESLHLQLYSNYEALGSGWTLILFATFGDMMYTLLIVLLIALVHGRLEWIQQPKRNDFMAIAFLGGLVACMVEYKALALHRWGYAAAMPIVPFLGVGLSPLLQMMLLTPLSVYVSRLGRVYSVKAL